MNEIGNVQQMAFGPRLQIVERKKSLSASGDAANDLQPTLSSNLTQASDRLRAFRADQYRSICAAAAFL